MTAMGANPTPMPIGEVYTGLKTGLIDAAENNLPSYEGFRHMEAAKVYSRTEHAMTPDVLFISKRIWDKLKPEQQNSCARPRAPPVVVQRQAWDAQEAVARSRQSGGRATCGRGQEAFRQAVAPVVAKFVNTPDLQRLVKTIQDTK